MIKAVAGHPVRGRKWCLPLTYAPKISGVIGGTIRQTIRSGRKYQVGDWIAFHGWSGVPRRSPWSFRTGYFLIHEVKDIIIHKKGIRHVKDGVVGALRSWSMYDDLAARDGIQPPTGEALGTLLMDMDGVPTITGLPMQIIRW
jgi:hypothetical protein